MVLTTSLLSLSLSLPSDFLGGHFALHSSCLSPADSGPHPGCLRWRPHSMYHISNRILLPCLPQAQQSYSRECTVQRCRMWKELVVVGGHSSVVRALPGSFPHSPFQPVL